METKKINIILGFVLFVLITQSCGDYLDIVPDNVPTIDHAFGKRHEAEGFLYGCFSFLPNIPNPADNPALLGGEEVWYIDPVQGIDPRLWYIARGDQGTNSPLADYWASKQNNYGLNGGKPIFTALRDCNIFLENIHKPRDLDDWERDRWIAEVKFLKAYYHFWLLRMYGPIPIIKENLPISSGSEKVQRYREPVDDVVAYIVELLDEAAEDLPLIIEDITIEMGRPTKATALSLKAQALTLAASPLFNGNTDYANLIDDNGVILISQEYSNKKWEVAARALKEAIDIAHEAGHSLYDFHSNIYSSNLSESTIAAMQVRGAVVERWNNEIIWGDVTNTAAIQRQCQPSFDITQSGGPIYRSYAPPFRLVEQFYTKNGIPIEEDKEWIGVDPMGLRTAESEHKYYIKEHFETINLHFDREARFYGAISFDGGTFYGNGKVNNDKNMYVVRIKRSDPCGAPTVDRHSSTGYLCKKLIHYLTSVPDNSVNFSAYRYAFPVIRLADLYVMYAEALNEWKDAPDVDVYKYIDLVRARTGLEGVVESWSNYSINPEKPLSKEGMRDIIQRERMNELAFEGIRFWDLRRWKLTEEYMNKPIRGLNIKGENAEDFYKVEEIYELSFENKDYLWPIRTSNLLNNVNLVQNSGW